MKRLAIVLAVVSFLALCQASQAADLKAGWYVDINQVWVWSYQWPDVPPHPVSWGFFTTEAGQYGPFTVSYPNPDNHNHTRVAVSSDTYGVGTEQSLILPIAFGQPDGYGTAYIGASVNTNYTASQMVLEFWRSRPNHADQMLATWPSSGNTWSDGQIDWGDGIEGNYYFKIAVPSVPEPTGMVTILSAIAFTAGIWRRRR